MQEIERYNDILVYCLKQIDILISKANKLNTVLARYNKYAKVLDISMCLESKVSEINFVELEKIKERILESINSQENNFYEIESIQKKIDLKINLLTDMIDKKVEYVELNKRKEIYEKARKLIAIAQWRAKEKEISYFIYKDTFIDKLTGEAKFRRLNLELKKLESTLIKERYYSKKDTYNGESIREIVIWLSNESENDVDVLNYRDILIKVFMIDKDSIDAVKLNTWKESNIVPAGFFSKIKHYKIANENLKCEIDCLNGQLSKLRVEVKSFTEKDEEKAREVEDEKNKINNTDLESFLEENNSNKNTIAKSGINKILNLSSINKDIRNLINSIRNL